METVNFLRNPPSDLTHIPPGFTLILEDNDSYWPFVSNLWSISTPANKATTEKTAIETSWRQCRFLRQPDAPTASGIVNSSRRDHTRTHLGSNKGCQKLEYGHCNIHPYEGF
ncbi:hypothetical protein V8E54_003177 [Elaphomyces granulatus]